MQNTPISTPAGFAAVQAIGFADSGANLALVSDDTRLPVSLAPAPPPALSGEAAFSQLVGPFEAVAGRVLTVELSGEFTGTADVLRSSDGGATMLPLRVGGMEWGRFSAAGCEQVWGETQTGASFFLDIVMESGTLSYKVSQ